MQILCYHDLGDRSGLGITRVCPQALADQLDYLSDQGWQFAPLSELQTSTIPERTLTVTFDDAYESQLQSALDILAPRSISATAFVVSDYVGKDATWDYAGRGVKHADWGLLSEWLAAGMAIGSHCATHCDLRAVSAERLKTELADSRQILSNRLGVEVTAVAYPFGRCDHRVVTVARDAGYTVGLGTQAAGGINPELHRPRIVASRLDTELSVAHRLEGTLWGRVERAKQGLVAFWAGGTPLYQRIRGDN